MFVQSNHKTPNATGRIMQDWQRYKKYLLQYIFLHYFFKKYSENDLFSQKKQKLCFNKRTRHT